MENTKRFHFCRGHIEYNWNFAEQKNFNQRFKILNVCLE